MEDKNLNINISTVTVLKTVGILLILAFAWFIRDIILLLFISIIFAAVIDPAVTFLEKKKIPRTVGVLSIYLFLFLFFVLVIRLMVPPIAEQVKLLSDNFPDLWDKVMQNFNAVRDFSVERGLTDNIQQGLKGLESTLETASKGVYSSIIGVFQSIVNFLVALAIIFYLVVQKNALGKLLNAIAPVQYHDYLIGLFSRIQKKIGDWAWGQLLLGLIIGVSTFIALLFFLPKYALVLALVAGATELIPYLGPILAAIPAVFLGFTVPPFSIGRGLMILALYVVIQQLEEKVVVPKVMERKVGINPVVIIIVMLIGFKVAGIIGLILAIPVTTAIAIVFGDFLQKSELNGTKEKMDSDDN